MSHLEDRRGASMRLAGGVARCEPCSSWDPPPEVLNLTTPDVHVWMASLDWPAHQVHALADILSEDERARAGRFVRERDQRRFIVCRGVLRTILGRYLGAAPSVLEFRYSAYGKPAINAGAGEPALRFNVSHADGVALYAVTRAREVGIDLERVRSRFATDEIAERFFSAREIAMLRAQAPASCPKAFFRIWTRKEAYLKARGQGLSASLRAFDVSVLPDEPVALLTTAWDPQEASRWRLEELFADDHYVATIAVEGDGWRLRRWRYEGGSAG